MVIALTIAEQTRAKTTPLALTVTRRTLAPAYLGGKGSFVVIALTIAQETSAQTALALTVTRRTLAPARMGGKGCIVVIALTIALTAICVILAIVLMSIWAHHAIVGRVMKISTVVRTLTIVDRTTV